MHYIQIFLKLKSKQYYVILITFILALNYSCNNPNGSKPNEVPLFSLEIAPIIYKNCTPCHRPGSGAPFDLLTYQDIKEHLQTIRLSITEHLMPPWPADTSYSHFRDEKVLTKSEMEILEKWFANGAPEGDPGDTPVLPAYNNGSRFGYPDMVLKMRVPFQIKGNNKDNFIMLKIPYEFPSDTFIRTIEIIPGNKKLVHHINAHLVQYQDGAKKNLNAGVPYVDTEKHNKLEAYKLLSLENDDSSYPLLTPSVTNYLPGVETAFYPENIGGYTVKKSGALLLDNIHYGPSPIDTTDVTTFNIFFSPRPPTRPTSEFILGTSGISPIEPPLIVPPNEVKKFTTDYTIPEDISLLTINPHMHLLGVSFLAYVLLPGGDTLHLIRIPKWDFRWQYFYTFEKIQRIPKNSIIHVEGVYDNTENNPLNPFHPPKTVAEREGSMRTTDEMFQLICTYLPYKDGDEKIDLTKFDHGK